MCPATRAIHVHLGEWPQTPAQGILTEQEFAAEKARILA